MKKLLFSLFLLLTFTALMAQAPQRISYQSIIRDANNVVVASSAISVKISLLRGTSTGPAVYVETHPITTNANGLVSLNIGEGTAITGTFAGIDWSNGPYLIQTATDPTGGTDYSIIGIAPLNSVPYALNAANASVATTLAGTLPIASGGTGATTATAARAALGLENVDNTSDANKPVSTATQTALSTKVDKVNGKELSTNDYSTAEKVRLAAITNDLAAKVDKVTGKELSTNDYSTAEKGKLAAITGNNTGDQVNIAGNAATATKLQATVTINGIAFDGSSNVTIPATGAVPYTGAAQGVDLGAYDLKVNGLTVGTGTGSLAVSNTVIGNSALWANTAGQENTAVGILSLYANTTGSSNTATGAYALLANTEGTFNTASGVRALYSNTSGSYNAANGGQSLTKNTTGYANTAEGMNSLYANTTGSSNTATGFFALSANTTGLNNTATGAYALYANTTGIRNTAIGDRADVGSGALTNATALGNGAIVAASNTIQLGNAAVTNVKTSGTVTAGAVTYPNMAGSTGQVLTTDGSGTASWAAPSAHYVGEVYGGGIVFYVYDGGKHGLIAATLDQSTGIKWSVVGNKITNANADGVGAGLKNTAIIIAVQSSNSAYTNPYSAFAATVCNGYSVTVGGVTYGDWYLPSKHELNLLYLQKSVVGGFASNDYWSSTEYSDTNAWFQNFGSGAQGYNYGPSKAYLFYVRAIRAF